MTYTSTLYCSLVSDELELNWDPLDASYKAMSVASKSLLTHQPQFSDDTTAPPTTTTTTTTAATGDCVEEGRGEGWREGFASDPCGSGDGERREDPLSPTREQEEEEEEEEVQESDVPPLFLQPGAYQIVR